MLEDSAKNTVSDGLLMSENLNQFFSSVFKWEKSQFSANSSNKVHEV